MKENSNLLIGDGSSSWTNRCRWCVSRSKAGASKRKNENKAVEDEEDGPVSTLFRFMIKSDDSDENMINIQYMYNCGMI
jgi:hypothetical protein